MQRWLALVLAVAVAGCTSPTTARAAYPDDSPPQIAGRVALAEGDAQIWRVEEDSSGQWDEAELNDVVSAGTGLYTGADGRKDVRVGPHAFRLGANSRGGFSQLDYGNAAFNLEYGTLNVRLGRADHGERSTVSVAGVQLELNAPGRYRIDATDRGPVRLTVFEGRGSVRSASTTVGVAGGQAIVVNPGGAGHNFEQAVATGFDQWALSRDERYRDVRSAQYVSPYMTGYEELDTYGDWQPDAAYGNVWYPRVVPVGWAPYRHGQWRWVRPWGWTWVDQAPWGYAPFHYGRWVVVGSRWAWVPGGFVQRPVWAPALVGFVGSNVSVSVNVGGPVIGWYPLAPWHRYQPHYRHNPTYVTIINQTIIQHPPRGVPPTINHGPGATMVPGPRFRDPVMKVALPMRPKAEDMKAVAPPPVNVAPAPRPMTRKFAEQEAARAAPGALTAPPARTVQPSPPDAPKPVAPPTRVMPPMVAEPMPGRGVSRPPALPGNDPTPLAQPPGLKRGSAPAALPAPHAAPPVIERPPPRPHMPSDQIPPGQARPINPAEPARFPPGAPPTVRQPSMAPAVRGVQPPPAPPLPATAPMPAPASARPVPPAAAPAAPIVAAPAPVAVPQRKAEPPRTQKEQVLRNVQEIERGKPEHAGPKVKER